MALTKASLIDVNGQELILDADADTSITADTDDQIDIKVGGSDTVHMGLTTYNASDRIVLTNTSGNASMTIVGGTSGESSIFMADGTSGDASYRGYLQYQHTNDNWNFGVAGAEKMKLTSDGKLHVTEIAQITSASLEIGNGDEKQIFDATEQTIEFQTADTERMRIDSNGKVFVGTTSTIISGMVNVENVGAANCFTGKVSNNAYYTFAGSNSSGTTTFYVKGDGDYYFAGTHQSDRDLKENIQPINESSLAKVKLLEPKTFNFKESEGYATNTKTGFIAQEVAEIFGTETGVASGTDGQKDMGVDTTGIVAHLTKAIQEQQEQIEALQSEINTLKGE